ncbi:MAG TPA: putative molybdenum carrier protein [Ktedonobacterales bacterium]|nr:putative molybdenum carrier protein [Ktedonobacterales bacterium]
MLKKVVSGGQSGVDRAALDAAGELGIARGGWCPRGRRAEDGPIPRRYRLAETPSGNYVQRTEWNVRDSDGTLIVNRGRLDGGTLLTAELARGRYCKPLLIVQLGRRIRAERFQAWLARNRVRVLNVAGPRESKRPGIYRAAKAVLLRLFSWSLPAARD